MRQRTCACACLHMTVHVFLAASKLNLCLYSFSSVAMNKKVKATVVSDDGKADQTQCRTLLRCEHAGFLVFFGDGKAVAACRDVLSKVPARGAELVDRPVSAGKRIFQMAGVLE